MPSFQGVCIATAPAAIHERLAVQGLRQEVEAVDVSRFAFKEDWKPFIVVFLVKNPGDTVPLSISGTWDMGMFAALVLKRRPDNDACLQSHCQRPCRDMRAQLSWACSGSSILPASYSVSPPLQLSHSRPSFRVTSPSLHSTLSGGSMKAHAIRTNFRRVSGPLQSCNTIAEDTAPKPRRTPRRAEQSDASPFLGSPSSH